MKPKICKRCNKEYSNPYPVAEKIGGILEIATKEWCADCNALTMYILFRDRSAFSLPNVRLR